MGASYQKDCSSGCQGQGLGLAYSPWIRALGRGGITGLVVRALTWNARGMDLNPTWSHTFPSKVDASYKFSIRSDNHLRTNWNVTSIKLYYVTAIYTVLSYVNNTTYFMLCQSSLCYIWSPFLLYYICQCNIYYVTKLTSCTEMNLYLKF